MTKHVLCYLFIDRSRGLPWTNHGVLDQLRPSITTVCYILSTLNQPSIQLLEMLSGKLYAPEGYQTFFCN